MRPNSGDRFSFDTYMVRRKVLKLFGAAFHIFDPNGQVVFFSKQKAFKLREDIRLYTGEDMAEEVLLIKARTAIDISATYDVMDSKTGEVVGALHRRGMRSILRDEWHILDRQGAQIGTIQEDSMLLALLRRFLSGLIPQKFTVTVGGVPLAEYRQRFNPIILKMDLDFSRDQARTLDRRLGLAAGVLLAAIDARQSGG